MAHVEALHDDAERDPDLGPVLQPRLELLDQLLRRLAGAAGLLLQHVKILLDAGRSRLICAPSCSRAVARPVYVAIAQAAEPVAMPLWVTSASRWRVCASP